jgi:hypothetical protein
MPSYRAYKFPKWRYHILGVRLVDQSANLLPLINAYKMMHNTLSPALQHTMEREVRYFIVRVRMHYRGKKSREKELRVPFDVAKDELGAYNIIREALSEHAIFIEPKGA